MGQSTALLSFELPSGDSISVVRQRFGTGEPRVALVAGIRGDAPEGIRVAFEVGQFLREHEDLLQGTVDIYPCVNPLAAEQGMRHWPFFEVDQNRQFPGKEDGHPPSQVAYHLLQDLKNVDLVVELRGARPGFSEVPQAFVWEGDAQSLEYAKYTNVAVVWKRKSSVNAPKTFAYQFPHAIILEGGRGNQLTEGIGESLKEGMLYLLSKLQILPEENLPFHWLTMEQPLLAEDVDVHRVRINRGGLFLPKVSINAMVSENDEIGVVIQPSTGEVLEKVCAPNTGKVIAMLNQPVVTPGSMVARIFSEGDWDAYF